MESRHTVSLTDMGPEDTSETCGHHGPLVACPQSCRPSPRSEPAAWWVKGAKGPFLPAACSVGVSPGWRQPHLSLYSVPSVQRLGSSGIWRAEAQGCL